MPREEETLKEDLNFLLRTAARAENESAFEELPYETTRDIVLPGLEQFERLIRQIKMETAQQLGICGGCDEELYTGICKKQF